MNIEDHNTIEKLKARLKEAELLLFKAVSNDDGIDASEFEAFTAGGDQQSISILTQLQDAQVAERVALGRASSLEDGHRKLTNKVRELGEELAEAKDSLESAEAGYSQQRLIVTELGKHAQEDRERAAQREADLSAKLTQQIEEVNRLASVAGDLRAQLTTAAGDRQKLKDELIELNRQWAATVNDAKAQRRREFARAALTGLVGPDLEARVLDPDQLAKKAWAVADALVAAE